MLRSIHKTIFFNFYYLPFRQAIKLPIWLYKPKFGKLGGTLTIDGSAHIKPGMIRMGYFGVELFANNGIYFSNSGNIIFKGRASIGNNSYISTGKNSTTIFGSQFGATTTFRLTCYNYVEFGEQVLFGWDCLVMDTDFHKLTRKDGSYTAGYAPIRIGSHNWFGNGCHIMKGAETPDYLTVQAGTWLIGKVDVPNYSVIGNKKDAIVIASDLWLDPQNEQIDYL